MGQRPFGSFPKIHRIWSTQASLSFGRSGSMCVWCGLQSTKARYDIASIGIFWFDQIHRIRQIRIRFPISVTDTGIHPIATMWSSNWMATLKLPWLKFLASVQCPIVETHFEGSGSQWHWHCWHCHWLAKTQLLVESICMLNKGEPSHFFPRENWDFVPTSLTPLPKSWEAKKNG